MPPNTHSSPMNLETEARNPIPSVLSLCNEAFRSFVREFKKPRIVTLIAIGRCEESRHNGAGYPSISSAWVLLIPDRVKLKSLFIQPVSHRKSPTLF